MGRNKKSQKPRRDQVRRFTEPPDSYSPTMLRPILPGGWQVNFQVPTQVPPGPNNAVALIYQDIPSNAGPTSQTLVVVFAAK